MIRESQIEAKVASYCKAHKYYCRKLSAVAYNGLPDRLVCHNGKALFLELKRPGNKPTPLQLREINLLMAAGMRADWADSYEEAVQIIADYFTEDVI